MITEIIDPTRSANSPALFVSGTVKEIPLSVTSGTLYTILHGLGRVPHAIFVAMADGYAQVKVEARDAYSCRVTFNATCNLILRVE